jgi:hypothetical protein
VGDRLCRKHGNGDGVITVVVTASDGSTVSLQIAAPTVTGADRVTDDGNLRVTDAGNQRVT